MDMDLTTLLPGDIILARDDGWFGKVIRFFENMQTRKAFANHVACVVDKGEVVEALAKIQLNPITKYDGKEIHVYRLPLSAKDREAFSVGMRERVNQSYGWFKLPLFALDATTTWIKARLNMKQPCFFFTKTFGISNIPVCSQLDVWGLQKLTAYRFQDEHGKPVDWRIVQPDYLEDLLCLRINQAVKVYDSSEK